MKLLEKKGLEFFYQKIAMHSEKIPILLKKR